MSTGIVSQSRSLSMMVKNNREGSSITSRGYRQSKARGISAHRPLDAALLELLRQVHADNYGVYGVRKIWHALYREGIAIGREQTARLMRPAGHSGKNKGRGTCHHPPTQGDGATPRSSWSRVHSRWA